MSWRVSFTAYAVIAVSATAFVLTQREPVASAPDAARIAQSKAIVAPVRAGSEEGPSREQLARGEYLTHSVAMCVVCHSPKDDRGRPVEGREFAGGVIPAEPTFPTMASWASHAPALSPLVGGAPEDVITLLKTGIVPRTGKPPKDPMPPFRLSDDDARAVVAYLRSLK